MIFRNFKELRQLSEIGYHPGGWDRGRMLFSSMMIRNIGLWMVFGLYYDSFNIFLRILCWPVTPAVSPISNLDIGSQNHCVQIRWTEQSAIKLSDSSQVHRKICSQNRCPYQVHRIIHGENQAYTDRWCNQRPHRIHLKRRIISLMNSSILQRIRLNFMA
jgi:hypothetical protein